MADTTFNFDQLGTPAAYTDFSRKLMTISDEIGFRVSSRGWCYLMEQWGHINKSQFDKVNTWINRCRKRGYLPVDFVAEESARQFRGVEVPDDRTPLQYFAALLNGTMAAGEYFDPDWWAGEKYYVQMVVEKVDLVTLFEPVCEEYKIPIANSRGWSSILQRAEYARRYQEAEAQGLKPVLLYCGDHDPDGLRISDHLRNNLHQLREVIWSDNTQGFDPVGLKVVRFGLDYEFIQKHKFTWIDNLITGGDKDLASPSHKNYKLPYVQEYLKDFGARKCESNVLVTDVKAARKLCKSAIEKVLGRGAAQRFIAKRQAVVDYIDTFLDISGTESSIEHLYSQLKEENTIMADYDWRVI